MGIGQWQFAKQSPVGVHHLVDALGGRVPKHTIFTSSKVHATVALNGPCAFQLDPTLVLEGS